MAGLNSATPRIVSFLEAHPKVKRVYWPLSPESRANYLRIARAPGAVGGMLSFTLKTPLAEFYDAVRLPKGPSFGMRNSLISPFIYIAHYDLVKSAAGRAELAEKERAELGGAITRRNRPAPTWPSTIGAWPSAAAFR